MAIHKKTKYFDDAGYEFTFSPIEDTLKIKPTKDGFEAKYLIQDDSPESPDAWGDENLFLVHYHRDFFVERKNIIREDDLADFYRGNKIEQEKKYHIFPVEAYIHGGVSLTLGSFRGRLAQGHYEFDVSHVGACLAKKDEFKTDEKGRNACESLVEEWNQYLGGDVYCIVKDKLDKDKKVIDHDVVCGYYGSKNAKQELESFEG